MPDDFKEQLKQQADIVKIIGEYVKLRKSGAVNWTGLCPFHKEKSGSFSVNAAHRFYHCFGCKASGDVFTFLMKLEGLSFPEAVRAVAAKAGVPLPKRDFSSPEEAREAGLRKQLLDLHEVATQYFEQALKSPPAASAREYLTSRAVTPETLAKFRIGFAPDDFNHMREALKPHFSEEVLRASGLFTSSEKNDDGAPTGPLYARFRKRITFPIANEAGKTIAFTARALSETDDKGRPVAKYLNSPETALYSKGHVLFNLHNAKSEMRTHDFALLVEGQMDCIRVYMAGIHQVLATSGTAFTEAQVRILSRFTRRAIVNFDPDTAGAAAAERSIGLLTEEGFEVRIMTLEGGLDPDRFVREHGVQAYMAALHAAQRQSDYLIERARTLFPGRTAEAKLKAMNFLLPHIRRSPNRLQREEFVDDAAQKLGIDNATLRQELKQAAVQRLESVASHRPAEPLTEAERVLLRALVRRSGDPARRSGDPARRTGDPARRTGDPAREAAAIGLAENPQWVEGLRSAVLLEILSQSEPPGNPLDAAPDEDSRVLLAEVLSGPSEDDTSALCGLVEGTLYELKRRFLERRLRELRHAIAEAERRNDPDTVRRLIAERMAIDRELRAG